MAEQQLSAPERVRYVVRKSTSGVLKVNEFQQPGFTIVGDHLAQHRELSLTAIGLGAHIQSLPEGSPVDIRTLAEKFPEGRQRIATALRELEAHGYLERRRERTENGKIVSLTISYNNPEATRARLAREAAATHASGQRNEGEPAPEEPEPARYIRPQQTPSPRAETAPAPVPTPVPGPAPAPALASPAPTPTAAVPPRPAGPRRVPPPLPEPRTPDPERRRVAADLLADLRRDAPCLLLAEREVRRLAPAVAAWLERGAAPDAVRRTLTANLPSDLRHPAAFLAYRLTELLPPPLPVTPVSVAALRPDPLQNCDTCDRAYRAPEPGDCPGCLVTEPARLEAA
jgi:DNA-binding MarR family transcriptional regulator